MKDDTTKAGEKAGASLLRPLGDREDRLNGNTMAVRGKAEANPNTKMVAPDIKDAADAMVDAVVQLFKAHQLEALPPQDKAVFIPQQGH